MFLCACFAYSTYTHLQRSSSRWRDLQPASCPVPNLERGYPLLLVSLFRDTTGTISADVPELTAGVALDSPKVKPLHIPSSRGVLRSKESTYTLYEISWWHERIDILTVSHGGSVQLHVPNMSPHYWSTSPCQWSVKHDHPSIHVLVTKSYASLIWLLTRNLFRITSWR